MNPICDVIIPLFTSVLGGLIGGLFTFLGVKMTIKNNNEIQRQAIREKNKEKNQKIISSRPEFKTVETKEKIENEAIMYVLPYWAPKLISKNEIYFDYDNINLDSNLWDYTEIILCNTGKKSIQTCFLELEYKSYFNIYTRSQIYAWQQMPLTKNIYSDKILIPYNINSNMYIKLKIFYPKSNKQKRIPNISLNCYMIDEDNNYWYQDMVNSTSTNKKSIPVSESEYLLHYRDNYYMWFVYDEMYFSNNVEKCFPTFGFEKELDRRKEQLRKETLKNLKFRQKIASGDITLNN